jgi:hypothetical protein
MDSDEIWYRGSTYISKYLRVVAPVTLSPVGYSTANGGLLN